MVENGTHVLVGSQLGPGMLCLADRQFFGWDLWAQARGTGADLLWRVKKNTRLPCLERWPDGSYRSVIDPSERHRATLRRRLQAAYEQPTYEAAKRALGKVRAELVLLNAPAVASLDEGLDDTLTLHRLGLLCELGASLKTTNAIESIHARVESRTAKVDHWKNSEQKQRWPATA